MSRVLLIGVGAAGSVFAKKAAQFSNIFNDIHIASRRIESCDLVKKQVKHPLTCWQVDADDTSAVDQLLKKVKPDLVVNLALPYQDLSIMDACLENNVHYLDTANYEPKDEAKFCYKWQWDYHDRFKEKNLTALLGCGFDPGVTNIFCSYAQRHLFDQIDTIDIMDCNDGNHGHPFATNFNPEINIREITQDGKYWSNGEWVHIKALSESKVLDFPEVGPRKAYLIYHEELESLVKHIPNLKEIRFWMTFSDQYLTYLDVLQNVGLTSIKPVNYNGQQIIPLQFLKQLLPDPKSLAPNYEGKTSIGCLISGVKNKQHKKVMIYNICEHQHAYTDVQAQGVSYTTGVPAVVGARLILEKKWTQTGVVNMEQLDPVPFLDILPETGLDWKVKEL
ncbi:saccharopine dehydrogenase [Candidatus Marinamargulisbacteria bacterium SCGC AG-410-N11]|nr:saccharopine dehydrogenase [Candidatus Marinamargulisbacteria bacterium SCGC AG-410-N11]